MESSSDGIVHSRVEGGRHTPAKTHRRDTGSAGSLELVVGIVDARDDVGPGTAAAVAENFDGNDVGRGGDSIGLSDSRSS